jgi:phosphoglycerate dehydrogenase-like enzyme
MHRARNNNNDKSSSRTHSNNTETKRPLDILLSRHAAAHFSDAIAQALRATPYRIVTPDDVVDAGAARAGAALDVAPAHRAAPAAPIAALISRDVTGHSTKAVITAETQRFYDALLAAPDLRWVHAHSAGIDRPIFPELLRRGVRITTSAGANARPVAHSALAGLLSLARRLPQLQAAQRAHAWKPLLDDAAPRDLAGQNALIVGYGAIGQRLAKLLDALEMNVTVVRREASVNRGGCLSETRSIAPRAIALAAIDTALPNTDWLILACPLSPLTTRLIDARRLRLLGPGAHLINVARGEVVVEADLIAALREGVLAGAYLDVFEHEPLDASSPLWDLPNVLVTPHTAGQADSHYAAVGRIWLDNLARFTRGEPLVNEVQSHEVPMREQQLHEPHELATR